MNPIQPAGQLPDLKRMHRRFARLGLIPSRWRLTKERIRRGYRQLDLAARMAPPVAPVTLCRYETGAYALHIGVVARAARALGCKVDGLVVGSLAVWEFENACRDEWHALGRPADLATMELIEARSWGRRRAG